MQDFFGKKLFSLNHKFLKFYFFIGSAPLNQIKEAVDFIDRIAASGKTCYVHCKAGRTRSATIATCYFIKKKDYLPNVAVEMIKNIRPTIHLRTMHWRSVNEYRRYLDNQKLESASTL